MRRTLLACLTICLVSPLQAQESAASPSSPPPLPPPPWIKRTPEFAQWVIMFTQETPAAAKPPPRDHGAKADPGFDRKYIVVTKSPGVLSETTTLQNGSVTVRYFTQGLSLAQIDGKGPWISSGAVEVGGFNVANYLKSDFAGFDWLSEQNYAGTQEITKKTCLIFRDKILALDPQEIEQIHSNIDRAIRGWQERQQLKQNRPVNYPTPGKAKGKAPAPASSPTPGADDPEPRPFQVNDYKTEVTAYVDADSGMPVVLTYKTLGGETESRSYSFPPAPTGPLIIPLEAQKLIDENQARLKRTSSASSVP